MATTSAPAELYFTPDQEANRLIATDPNALLIGFALDQQVTVQKAFSGPLELKRRLGHLDPARIASVGLSVAQVESALTANNDNAGGGFYSQGGQFYYVRGLGRIATLEDIGNVVLAVHDGVPILVKDVGRVQIGIAPRLGEFGFQNQDDAVEGVILLRTGEKTQDVLRGVDLAVTAGGITGLIGPNGAGKTTLFNVVSGLVPPDAGSVRFDGRGIAGLPPDAVSRRGLVRTFQVARGFPRLSVFQHLMLYGRDQPGESLWQAIVGTRAARAREAELAERAWQTARFLRLDHLIDNPATALSGGQKKLLEIGRALMAEPRLVLLDEPTAGVNPTLQNEIGERLLELPRRGITVLLIEHDMGFIAHLCDPVIVMAEGQVLTQGTFDEVRADHRVREAYLGRRAA